MPQVKTHFTTLMHSARDVVRAEKACVSAGIPVAVVPPPAGFSAQCGMALKIALHDEKAFDKLMIKSNIYVANKV